MTTKKKVPIFLSFPYTEPDINYHQKALLGLGKPTKRGIKKCFNCGVYNGTRSAMCKNKECGVILKDSEEKSKIDIDAVKLLTGTERQVYSVRVRDMGPDYRGFVQLPLLQSHNDEDTNIFSNVALCFVDSCQNSFDNSILKCHEEDQNDNNLLCAHIKSALKSHNTATPIEVKNQVLHSLNITEDVRTKLYLLATEREGPLVQRVSKSIMAIKCQVTPKHPLGYLHFIFVKGKGKEIYEKYYCSCLVSGAEKDKSSNIRYKCLHYYACIWALASNSKYVEEFSHFVGYELPTVGNSNINMVPCLNIHQNTNNSAEKNSTERRKQIVEKKPSSELKLNLREQKKFKKSSRKSVNLKKCKRLMPKVFPVEIKVLNELQESIESTSWNFIDWLSYVTESINKTMQFDNCGILNTLIFHIPEEFYRCFKKRIPSMYAEAQSDISFSYYIMNILHLKEIFDTPQIKLKISKKFVHNEQKGYVEHDENEENSESYQCPFIFFLNVGQSTVDESDNTNNSFVIEWLPSSMTCLTQIGQLKFQYKYGRKST